MVASVVCFGLPSQKGLDFALGSERFVPAKHRTTPQLAQAFFLLSTVRRKRNDSVPVSIMCARSVIRSNSALHNRGFGNTVVHSEKGKFVVTMMAARSALSEIT